MREGKKVGKGRECEKIGVRKRGREGREKVIRSKEGRRGNLSRVLVQGGGRGGGCEGEDIRKSGRRCEHKGI